MDANTQNRAIAHALGKCTHPISDWVHEGPDGDREIFCSVCRQKPYTAGFPDYLNDLNAMHEVEGIVITGLAAMLEYERQVRAITLRDAAEGSGLYERIIRATAKQRAEAVLRTLNLWKE